MADPDRCLTPQEERDLIKFQKFFSFKFVQVIVQSRLGEKFKSASKPNAMGYDWFNLAISDIHEVLEETKKITANNKIPSKNNPLCVEVSLRTNEGNSMVLETWRLGMNEKCENSNKITFAIYNRMGVLLKSLICVSRVTPAYKVAQKQGHDYILCYRIYFGKVRIAELGEDYRSVSIGTIGTPKGGITMSVTYRTKLTLPDSYSQSPELSRVQYPTVSGSNPSLATTMTDSGMQYPVAMTTEFRQHIAQEIASAVADTDITNSNLSPQTFNAAMSCSGTIATPPLLEEPSTAPTTALSNKSQENGKTRQHDRCRTLSETLTESRGNGSHGAFASIPSTPIIGLPSLSSTPPFASLLSNTNMIKSSTNQKETGGNSIPDRETSEKSPVNETSKKLTSPRQVTLEDDFIMVELRAAFAPQTSSTTDLTQFYRECQNAPPLDLFRKVPAQPLRNIMGNFTSEIDVFERDMKNFDDFINELEEDKKT